MTDFEFNFRIAHPLQTTERRTSFPATFREDNTAGGPWRNRWARSILLQMSDFGCRRLCSLLCTLQHQAALLPYLPEDEQTKKLQSYTPGERSEVMPALHGRSFQHGLEMVNFSFCPRASISFALFGFLLSGMQLPTFNSRLVLYQIQLQSDHLIPELLRRGGGTHFWNCTYIDYFLKVRDGFEFTAVEIATSQAYVVGRDTSWNLSRHLFGRAPHCQKHFAAAFCRYQHLLLPASSWNDLNQLSGYDEYVAPALVQQHLRARL